MTSWLRIQGLIHCAMTAPRMWNVKQEGLIWNFFLVSCNKLWTMFIVDVHLNYHTSHNSDIDCLMHCQGGIKTLSQRMEACDFKQAIDLYLNYIWVRNQWPAVLCLLRGTRQCCGKKIAVTTYILMYSHTICIMLCSGAVHIVWVCLGRGG